MALKQHLAADLEDEQEAITTYGKRITQHPQLRGMYQEMRGDEHDHAKKLAVAKAVRRKGSRRT